MWREIWIIMLILAFICLVIAVLLTFLWDIVNLIDELSGRKAKRQIKMLHELNSGTDTGTFDRLSTNEIYSGISSGVFVSEESSNTYEDEVEEESTSYLQKEDTNYEDESTSYLQKDNTKCDDEESTSFLGDNLEESTSYLDVSDRSNTSSIDKELKIKIIEEQTSLRG